MTKKDYILAAQVIRDSGAKGEVLDQLFEGFVELFRRDNPRFDIERFEMAVRQGMIKQRPGSRYREMGR